MFGLKLIHVSKRGSKVENYENVHDIKWNLFTYVS